MLHTHKTWKILRQQEFNKETAAQANEMIKEDSMRSHFYYHTLINYSQIF
jgi:hypothetical protein